MFSDTKIPSFMPEETFNSIANSLFLELVLLPKQEALIASLRESQNDSEVAILRSVLQAIDPSNHIHVLSSFLVIPFLSDFEANPSLQAIDQAFSRWSSVLTEQAMIDWRSRYTALYWRSLIEDLEKNTFPWESPNLFPLLLELKPSLSKSFIQSFILSLTEFLWKLCSPIEIPEISTISIDPQIVETGKKVLEFISNLLQFGDLDIRPITGIPKLEEILQLTMHSLLCENESILVLRYVEAFRSLLSNDPIYMKLFLVRWSFVDLNVELELRFVGSPLSASTCAAIKTLLIRRGRVNRRLFSSFVGEEEFVVPANQLQSKIRDQMENQNQSENQEQKQKAKQKQKQKQNQKQDQEKENEKGDQKQNQESLIYELQSEFGRVELEVEGKSIRCCPAQAMLLMLFDQKEWIAWSELIEASPFNEQTTKRVVDSLTCCEVDANGVRFVAPREDVELPSLFRISLDARKKEEVDRSLFNERDRIASWAIQCVKKKKRVSEKAIEKFVEKHIPVDAMAFKEAIEYLIEGEYLRRAEDNPALLELQFCFVCCTHSGEQTAINK